MFLALRVDVGAQHRPCSKDASPVRPDDKVLVDKAMGDELPQVVVEESDPANVLFRGSREIEV